MGRLRRIASHSEYHRIVNSDYCLVNEAEAIKPSRKWKIGNDFRQIETHLPQRWSQHRLAIMTIATLVDAPVGGRCQNQSELP